MLTNVRRIIRRLKHEGWKLNRANKHYVFIKDGCRNNVVIPRSKRDIPIGTALAIYKQAGWKKD